MAADEEQIDRLGGQIHQYEVIKQLIQKQSNGGKGVKDQQASEEIAFVHLAAAVGDHQNAKRNHRAVMDHGLHVQKKRGAVNVAGVDHNHQPRKE